MTQAPGHMPFSSAPPPPPAPPRSGLAIGALVCSLLFFIPFLAPALGLILGIIAAIIIASSRGRQRGMGMAIAAIAISIPMLVGHTYATIWAVKRAAVALEDMVAEMTLPAERFLFAVEAGDFDAARDECTSATASQLSDEEMEKLQKRIATDLGAFEKLRFDLSMTAYQRGMTPTAGRTQYNPNQPPTPQQAQNTPAEMPVKAVFANRTLYGLAVLAFDASAGPDGSGDIKLVEIKLVDGNGRWTIPAGGAAPTGNGPSQSAPADDQTESSPAGEVDDPA